MVDVRPDEISAILKEQIIVKKQILKKFFKFLGLNVK
jgi:hypothetical protein